MKTDSTRRPRAGRILRMVTRQFSQRGGPSRAPAPAERLDVPLGNRVRTPVSRHAVVVMFVVVGLPPETVARVVAEVSELQVMLASFRPVFVTDCDEFQIFRRYGYLFEYIPPQGDWCGRFGDSDWGSFLQERMDLLLKRYAPHRVIGFDDVDRFTLIRTGILDSLVAPARPPTKEQKAFVGPFPPTRLGRLMRRTAEIYVKGPRVEARQLMGRLATRLLNRGSRPLPRDPKP